MCPAPCHCCNSSCLFTPPPVALFLTPFRDQPADAGACHVQRAAVGACSGRGPAGVGQEMGAQGCGLVTGLQPWAVGHSHTGQGPLESLDSGVPGIRYLQVYTCRYVGQEGPVCVRYQDCLATHRDGLTTTAMLCGCRQCVAFWGPWAVDWRCVCCGGGSRSCVALSATCNGRHLQQPAGEGPEVCGVCRMR